MQFADNLRDATSGNVGGTMTQPPAQHARDVADQNFREFQRCFRSGHKAYLDEAIKNDRFYRGEQWDPQDLAKLKAEGRPALTINKILSTVNTIAGEQRLRRADFLFKPVGDSDQQSAIALTKLAMAVAEGNQFDFIESQVFMDGIIENRGFYDIRMNWDEDPAGEVEITQANNRMVLLDPDADEYDPLTWRQVITSEFMSLDDIATDYGQEKADALRYLISNGDTFGAESIGDARQTFGTEGEAPSDTYDPNPDTDPQMAAALKRIRVINRQYFKTGKAYYLVDPASGAMKPLPTDVKDGEAKALAKQLGAFLYSRQEKKVRWVVSADHVTLSDDWSPYRTFTIIPYFPLFRRGRPLGLVSNLRSPQEQLNKLSSQELHIVNTTANSGYMVEKGSLANMSTAELASKGSKSGVVIEYNPGKRPPEKIQANSIPTGIDRITQMSAMNIKEISGVNDAMLGQENAQVSGVALDKKRVGGLTQMQVPMDNLTWSRWFVARKLLELFQDFYTDERIVHFSDLDNKPQRVAINEVQEDGTVANDITYGKFRIVISSAPARDTYNDSQFAEALNMRAAGVQIPDYRIIEKSNLGQKDEIAQEVRQLQGLGEPTPEQQEMAALQQEISLKMLVAELEKLYAEIAQMQAKAMQLQVAAQTEAGKSNAELEKLEAQIQIKREEFDLRQRLALLSSASKLDSLQMSNTGQLQRQMLQNMGNAQIKAAQEHQKNTPNAGE